MNTTEEDLMALSREPSEKLPLADESDDLMALTGKPSGESSFAEDKSTPDLMPPFENASLGNKSPEELIIFLKNQSLENLSNYAILGVAETASKKVIRKKYLALAQLTHPDKGEENIPLFQAIGKAYESLIEKSTISPHQEEDERNLADEQGLLDLIGPDELFSVEVDDYLTDPQKKQITLYDKHSHDPDKDYIKRGRALIEQNYAPYMSHEKFLDLHPKTQKEFAILLAKQEEAYQALRANSNHTSLNNLTPDDIYDSIDLDSPHLEEVRGKIIVYCQQARLSEQSLNFLSRHILNANSIAAITTDVTETVEPDFTETSNLDVSELYLRGWLLIHGEEGVKSGALKLFLSYPQPGRTQLATAVGRYQAEYPGHNLMSIFDHYGIANKEKREAAFNDCINTDRKSFFFIYRKKYPTITIEGCEIELTKRFYKLCQSEIMDTFAQDLKKVSVPKDDKDWYQLGIKSIEKSQGPLTSKKREECTEKSEEENKLLEEGDLSNTLPYTASNISTQFSFFEERSFDKPKTTASMLSGEPLTASPPRKRRRTGPGSGLC